MTFRHIVKFCHVFLSFFVAYNILHMSNAFNSALIFINLCNKKKSFACETLHLRRFTLVISTILPQFKSITKNCHSQGMTVPFIFRLFINSTRLFAIASSPTTPSISASGSSKYIFPEPMSYKTNPPE